MVKRRPANWKPSNDVGCFPYPSNKISASIHNDSRSKYIYLWLDVKEAEEFANAILEQVEMCKRITGIRTAKFAQRWF